MYGEGINDFIGTVQRFENYVDDFGNTKSRRVWVCPFYYTWASLMQRCFDNKLKLRNPTYKDVTCIEDWKYFTLFKAWMEAQNWSGMALDKDIIVKGNKIYSPDNCAFVRKETNKFVIASDSARGEFPVGVSFYKPYQKFRAQCSNPFRKTTEHLGYFLTPEEAHESWRKRKHEFAQLVAETENDPRVVAALKKRYSYEEWYK